ncbi:MAG: hypothetical protein ACK5MD_02450 [Flavobacteriales bacterium]
MKYFLIFLVIGIIFYMFTQSKNSRLKQKQNRSHSKVGETTVYQTKKNQNKIQVDAEDVEFEEIKKHEYKE